MPLHNNPAFLVLEGMDGAGTTTQTLALTRALEALDLQVLPTAEPTDGPIGRLLRTYVRKEVELDSEAVALLFAADRSYHLSRFVRPALEEGKWVVCDRYLLSTLAYQGAQGVDRSWILEMSRRFQVPDLTLVLFLPEDERLARVDGRGPRERFEDGAWGGALRESYVESIQLLRAAGHRIEEVDASGPPAEVTQAILELVDEWRRAARSS